MNKPRILIVDDDATMRRAVINALGGDREGSPFLFETAVDGLEAIDRWRRTSPSLIILDVTMPKMDGIAVCRFVKESAGENFVPIILVSSRTEVDDRVSGLAAGADDYLVKPFAPRELSARVEAMMRIKARQDQALFKQKELEALSATDSLTGLLNHRAMQERLNDEYARARRYRKPLALLMLDADHFKLVNDTHGHQFGDQVLSQLGQILKRAVRSIDVVARYGGEEFMVILPETHLTGSLVVAERIWRTVGEHSFATDKNFRLTVSLGISFYPNTHVESADDLVKDADRALYKAKQEGRNRICLHQHVDATAPAAADGTQNGVVSKILHAV